ncbi:AzlC family ABC transporter permease [Actinomycetes bacterium KLBMP 9759]
MPERQHTDRLKVVLPVAAADLVDGLAFGALAVSLGMGVIAPVVMSALVYSGSAQYGALAVMSQHGSLGAAVGAAAALNARYLLMGTTIAPALGGSLRSRIGRSLLITDAAWAVAHRGDGRFDVRLLTLCGLLSLSGWTLGTAVGAVLGSAVGDPAAFGIDAAYPVFFIGLLREHLTDRRAWVLAVVGVLVAVALTPLLTPGIPILIAALCGVLAGAVMGERS